MANIQNYETAPDRRVDGAPYHVTRLARVEIDAFGFVTEQGTEAVALALTYGTDPRTGKELSLVINPETMKELLREPKKPLADALRAARAERRGREEAQAAAEGGVAALEVGGDADVA